MANKIDALTPELIATIVVLLPPANACVVAAVCKRWAECVQFQCAVGLIKAKYFLPERTALAIARRLISRSPTRWFVRSNPPTPPLRLDGAIEIFDPRNQSFTWKVIYHSKNYGTVHLTGVTNRFVEETDMRISTEITIHMHTENAGTITLGIANEHTTTRFRHCSAADALRACGVRVVI